MTENHYSMLVLWSEDDEAYLAHIVELPGCIAHGETREEAVHNAAIAIENWIDTAKELKREIPAPVDVAEFEKLTARQAREWRNRIEKAAAELAEGLLSVGFGSLYRSSSIRAEVATSTAEGLDLESR
jgi:predicted RNase H-like HicB family nuclease